MSGHITDPFAVGADAAANRVYSKTSGELATMLERMQRQIDSGDFRSLAFDVPELDGVIDTLWPGTLTMVVARPSHRKSSTLKHLARIACRRIMEEHENPLRSGLNVVFVTLEESEVSVALGITGAPFTYGDMVKRTVEPGTVTEWSDQVARWPLLVVGPTLTVMAREIIKERPQPRLTIEQAYREIHQAIEDGHGAPTAILVDYVQRAATEGVGGNDREKSIRVGNAVARLAEMAQRLNVPVVLAAQAGRQVDGRTIPAPDLGDAQWSSQLEQDADTVLGLWYPAKTGYEGRQALRAKLAGELMEFGNVTLGYDDLMRSDVLTVWLRKQRHGVMSGQWAVRCDPSTGALSSYPPPTVTLGGRS